MSKYAVIRIKGGQYKVKEGDKLVVDKISSSTVSADVLLFVDGDKVKIGKPIVAGAKVKLSIESPKVKGKKLYVQKFKAKSRYRKKIGFRPQHSILRVDKITIS